MVRTVALRDAVRLREREELFAFPLKRIDSPTVWHVYRESLYPASDNVRAMCGLEDLLDRAETVGDRFTAWHRDGLDTPICAKCITALRAYEDTKT